MRLETDYIENYLPETNYGFEMVRSLENIFWMMALASTLSFVVAYTSLTTSFEVLRNMFQLQNGHNEH